MRVLVVDDDPAARRLGTELVRALGHETAAAGSLEEAEAAVRAHRPRVVLSDWVLGGPDGLELCRRLRARTGQDRVYFILVSGSRQGRSDYEAALEAGADDFLPKPVSLDVLRARLQLAERLLDLMDRAAELEERVLLCPACGRVKGEDGGYRRLEHFLEEASLASFTHGICPDCRTALTGGGRPARREGSC